MLREGVVGELVTVRGRNKCGRKSGNEFTEMGTHVADMMLCFGGEPEWCAGSVWSEGRLAEVGDIMEAKEMSPKDRDSGLVVGERAVGQYGFANGVLGKVSFLGYKKLMNANYGVDVLGAEGQLAIRASGLDVWSRVASGALGRRLPEFPSFESHDECTKLRQELKTK